MDAAETPEKFAVTLSTGDRVEVYSLQKAPEPGSVLVQVGRREILQDLQLGSVLVNLERTANLLFLAYNGVAGARKGELQARLSGLQRTHAQLCHDCVLAMQTFKRKSGEVLDNVMSAYGWLIEGEEDVAIKKLARCGQSAATMAQTAEDLAQRFDELGASTQVVLEATVEERGAQHDARLALEKAARELKAEQARAIELNKQLVEAVEDMQRLYDEAREREATESERAFILGITSAITSAIGAGVGAFAAAQNPLGSLVGAARAPQASGGTQPPGGGGTQPSGGGAAAPAADTQALRKQAEQVQMDTQKANEVAAAAATAAEQAAQDATRANEAARKAEEEARAAQDAAARAEKEKAAAELRRQAEESRIRAEQAAERAQKSKARAEALAKSLNQLSEQAMRMQELAARAADVTRSEKMKFLDQKLELKRQQREAVASMALYAEQIKNTAVDRGIAEAAVTSLHIAVRALSQIVTSLLNASLFFRSMEQYCKALSQSKLMEDIEDIKELAPAKRTAYYGSEAFVGTAVAYAARWKALELISGEYQEAATRAAAQVKGNINRAPSIEESLELAPQLANTLLGQLQVDIKLLDEDQTALRHEREALVPA